MEIVEWYKDDVYSNIEYALIDNGTTVTCLVRNIETKKTMTENYECMYPPVFGRDASDNAKLDDILEAMIEVIK